MLRLLLVLLAAVGVVLVAGAVTSKLYRIPSPSMEPTLHCSQPTAGCRADEPDRVAVSRVVYAVREPRRGDIVAYRISRLGAERCGARPNDPFLHRIAAVPGDRLTTRAGAVLVNGKRVGGTLGRTTLPPRATVAKDRYVVIGDNDTRSCDSRVWGFVERKAIIGPKIATYWPPDRISLSIG